MSSVGRKGNEQCKLDGKQKNEQLNVHLSDESRWLWTAPTADSSSSAKSYMKDFINLTLKYVFISHRVYLQKLYV